MRGENKGGKPRKRIQIEGVLNEQSVTDAHFFIEHKHKCRHNSNYAKSAYLYKYQYDDLSEHAKGRGDWQSHKSRHAGSRRCGEERVDIGYCLSALRAYRK